MPKRLTVTEKDLAAMAKRFRTASGKNRAQAARELGVARQAVIYAEDRPEKSFFKLRKRMIEKYSPYKVVGPVFWLEKK
jgi:DNA-binding XRE family transcriptional regulator